MHRRACLKAIAAVGVMAAIPASLVPAWKPHEAKTGVDAITFKGIPLVYDEQ